MGSLFFNVNFLCSFNILYKHIIEYQQHYDMQKHIKGVFMDRYMFNAKVFVIPNSMVCKYSESDTYWSNIKRRVNAAFDKLGIIDQIRDNDVLVQIWTTSDGSDNWSDHGLPEEIQEKLGVKYGDTLPDMLPLRWFNGLQEGESTTIYMSNENTDNMCIVTLTCDQIHHRYGGFGPFQNVITLLEGKLRERIERAA